MGNNPDGRCGVGCVGERLEAPTPVKGIREGVKIVKASCGRYPLPPYHSSVVLGLSAPSSLMIVVHILPVVALLQLPYPALGFQGWGLQLRGRQVVRGHLAASRVREL